MNVKKIISALLAALMLLSIGMTGIVSAAELPFTDVAEGDWFYGAVEYAYKNEIMNGTGDGSKFSPSMSLTRAMVVTVLYRIEGDANVTYSEAFADVEEGQYYTNAANWAYDSGIVTGTGEDIWGDPLFSPDKNITRQELATMIGRFADHCHVDITKNTSDINSFPDASSVATWAADTFRWTYGTGIITGKTDGGKAFLAPAAEASRAEFATIIKRFCEKDDAREFSYFHAYETPRIPSQYTEKPYPPVKDADIYVAVDGDDNAAGTLEEPLATFAAAKAKVLELKQKKTTGEIKVAFMAGNYGALEGIKFTTDDGGNDNLKITYCAYGDGEVIFQNGISLPGESFSKIDDSEKYLFKEENYDYIYKTDLSDVVSDDFNITALFSNSGICHEARIPNKAENGTDRNYSNLTTTVDKYSSIQLQGRLPAIVEGFRTTEGMRVTGFLRVGWLVETFDVKSYDPETGIVTFNTYEGFVPTNGYPIGESAGGFDFMYEGRATDTVFFHNLSDQLDAKGEYWFDPSTKILYVYKPEGTYTITTGGKFIDAVHTENIQFIGLTFNASADVFPITFYHCDHITFDRCVFSNYTADRVINFDQGIDFKFINNEMFNFGASGVFVTPFWKDRLTNFEGSYHALKESEVLIDNNYFHDFGFIDMWSTAVGMYCSTGTVVSHNYFKNGAHAAVEYNGSNCTTVEYNVFDNMMMTTSDYGAVYTNWGFEDRSNIVRYNVFMNMRAVDAQYSIYLDGDSAGNEIYGNLFFSGGSCGITINGGRDHVIYDNIFIKMDKYSRFYFSNLHRLTSAYLDGDRSYVAGSADEMNTISKYIPQEGEQGYEMWKERWPILYQYNDDFDNLGDVDCLFTTVNYVYDNYQIGDEPISEKSYILYGVGKETNTVLTKDENPFFKDPTHGDYSIIEGFDLYFPFDEIGRY